MPTNCPNCNSEQKFVVKLREVEAGWQEKYIRCLMCRWETVVDYTTTEIETLRIKSMKMAERKQWEQERHGSHSGTLAVKHREVRKELATLLSSLYTRVREANGSTPDHEAPA